MIVFYWSVFIIGLSSFGVQGRAVNISNAWFLPQEGFPVFYRHFSDKVTWNEAEAVCGFHHADLLSVQTSIQMDAARAYLKELDITDNTWIGLQKESPEKPFSWTNGEKLLGDGYWLEPIPKTNEKLCAAIDPISDFRWNSFYCRGPQVASFVCELPVPEWAKKEDGCMITSLPSLTVTLIPEMGVIQLFSDCGLDGTRRIACKGGVNRDEIIKRLSCNEDALGSTIFSKSTTDTIKETNTLHGFGSSRNDVTTQTFKSWGTYSPQTRHRRSTDVGSLDTGAGSTLDKLKIISDAIKLQTETSTQSKAEVVNVPSHVFPHSPYSASERNAPSTKTPSPSIATSTKAKTKVGNESEENVSTTETSKTSTTQSEPTPSPVFPNDTTMREMVSEKPTQKSLSLKEGNKTEVDKEFHHPGVPLLVITAESVNYSVSTNSATTTSENPQIVFMIEEKSGLAEPYLVPLGDEVIINNPSLSPMEIIDVDLVEFDNITTKSAGTSETSSKPQKIEVTTNPPTTSKSISGVHPMKIGERRNFVNRNEFSTATPSTLSNTTTPRTTLGTPASTDVEVSPKVENEERQSQNFVEREDKGDGPEVPQRPNRGRLLTHSSHPSFYPYFLNKVLG